MPLVIDHGAGDQGYHSDGGILQSATGRRRRCQVRKRGVPWTEEEEHRTFLTGLEKLGKGDWRGISVMSICEKLVLLFLAPLFKYTPWWLIDCEEAYRLFKVDKFDFLICMAAFFGVIFYSMTGGLLISVCVDVIKALLYIARRSTCELGSI